MTDRLNHKQAWEALYKGERIRGYRNNNAVQSWYCGDDLKSPVNPNLVSTLLDCDYFTLVDIPDIPKSDPEHERLDCLGLAFSRVNLCEGTPNVRHIFEHMKYYDKLLLEEVDRRIAAAKIEIMKMVELRIDYHINEALKK